MRTLTQIIAGIAIALLNLAYRLDPDKKDSENFTDWIPKRIKIVE